MHFQLFQEADGIFYYGLAIEIHQSFIGTYAATFASCHDYPGNISVQFIHIQKVITVFNY